jgi:hypothetical protein
MEKTYRLLIKNVRGMTVFRLRNPIVGNAIAGSGRDPAENCRITRMLVRNGHIFAKPF